MNTRWRVAIILAGVSGLLLATAVGFAYPQYSSQKSRQGSCDARMNNGRMGMMGGMSHYGSMSQETCGAEMSNGMGSCQAMAWERANQTLLESGTMPCK